MRNRLFLFIIALIISSPLYTMAVSDSSDETEQRYLSLNYVYENVYGIHFDTMQNLDLFDEVLSWIGTPYRYSGDSQEGIDCSGFVCTLYKSIFNRVLASSSKDIYNENIIAVKKEELSEGDLVFFKIRKKRVSHVGIYLGNNLFAHSSTQQGVIISSLTEKYYSRYFYKGGRLKS